MQHGLREGIQRVKISVIIAVLNAYIKSKVKPNRAGHGGGSLH